MNFSLSCVRLSIGEVLEKLLYGFFLLLVEEVVVVHDVLQILQVAEQLVGIYQVLVGIVEVADKQLAPEIEIIQSSSLCVSSRNTLYSSHTSRIGSPGFRGERLRNSSLMLTYAGDHNGRSL